MKKVMSFLIIVTFFLLPVASFAENAKPATDVKPTADKKTTPAVPHIPAMAGRPENLSAHYPPVPFTPSAEMLKMQKLRDRSVVATSDGGVVLVFGDKIMKYDKDLKLVKETEVKL
jgi:hypothetical protein